MANFFDQFDEKPEETASEQEPSETGNFFDQFDEKSPTKSEAPVTEDGAPSREELDAISTQMYAGMSYADAVEYYEGLMNSPDVTPPPSIAGVRLPAYAMYKDPETGRREYIPAPMPNMNKAFGDAVIQAVQAPFSEDVSLADAADTFSNPEARVSTFDKVALGLGESVGATIETGAALAEKAGIEGAMETMSPLIANIDTGDSVVDGLITDGVPAMLMAVSGGAAAQQVVKNAPKFIKGAAVLLGAEGASAVGTSTDEGNLLLGDEGSTLFPIASGLDLGSSEADAVLEQRFNTLVEGMFLNSTLAGVVGAGIGAAQVVSKFTLGPILSQGRQSAIERRVYEEITEKLGGIDANSTPQQRALIRDEIAEIVGRNKKVLVATLTDLSKDTPVQLDTISALLREVNDPASRARIGGELTGQIQRGGQGASRTIAATEQPVQELQQQMEAYLSEVGGQTARDRTATIAQSADELAALGRNKVDAVDTVVSDAQAGFDDAANEVLDGIRNADVELGGQLSRLEDVTGTDIVTGQTTSFNSVRDGLVEAKTTMTKTKDELYSAVPEGTPFDYKGFADVVDGAVAAIDDLDTSGTRTKSLELISTIRSAMSPRQVVEAGEKPAFGLPINTTRTIDGDDLAADLLDGGVDFQVLYNRVRPQLSKLIDQAYKRGDDLVAERLITVKNGIDEQVEWVAENGDEEASAAATAAYNYYKDEFAPIWRDGGVMERFGNLYSPVLTRGTQKAEFLEQSRDLVEGVLSGNNADAVVNMKTALSQVQDPKPIADYMIADVINGFAGAVRSDGMSATTLKGMSDRLRQYSVSLNEAFPERAAQINSLVSRIENAAGQERVLQQALKEAEELATQTRKEVRSSELGKFLSNLPGRNMETNLNPEQSFAKIFNEAEGIGSVSEILAAAKELPEAQASVVQDGIETAYLRYLSNRITGARMQSGGSQSLKGGATDTVLQESNNVLNIGREVFGENPEIMDTVETLLEASRMIERQKQAQPVPGMSPTVFNQEATQATNRLIMTLVGPLTRTGAKLRSLAGASFDYFDSGKKASLVLDNILSDPDYFLELSRKYNRHPMDPLLQENLITALTATTTKTVNAEAEYLTDQSNQDQQMGDLLGYK